ncbi:autotransporter outer membrane beta-barrel domain-containing protein [Oryzifoliimicrobium ureilyticus]|uniref:autotransporter outer membrane beta-barrel domain-containing protein n=1 Tax=Oryzifoliimicrobium ureilyticus TaxID=3113724 RepID=UPI0030765B67
MAQPVMSEASRNIKSWAARLGCMTALVSVLPTFPSVAQSVWTGASDNSFGNSANWTPGPPAASDTAAVNNGSPQVVDHFVITELDVNGGNVTITDHGDLTATGGTAIGSGSLTVNSGGVLSSDVHLNGGNLAVGGTISGHLSLNNGNVTVDGSLGSASVAATTSLTNNGLTGDVDVSSGGTFVNNSGASAGAVTNSGTASNSGTVSSLSNDAGAFTNNTGGTVTGLTTVTGGTVTNNFVITDADVAAAAVFVNNSGARAGNVTNAGTSSNAGSVAALRNVDGTFTNNNGGVVGTTIIQGGTVINNAAMADTQVSAAGTFVNNSGAEVQTVTSAGLSSNAGTVAALTNTAGSFTNNAGGTVTGKTLVQGGTVVNNFVITDADVSAAANFVNNSGARAGSIVNAGSSSNAGTIAALTNTRGDFTNNAGGTITGTTVITGGNVVNNSSAADIEVTAGGQFTNNRSGTTGLIVNSGTVSNDGVVASVETSGGNFANTGTVTGSATIYAGTLTNTGEIVGAVNVFAGGLLGGTGITGGLTIAKDGTLDAGSGIETTTVSGNARFLQGSAYVVDITPDGQADRLNVSGALEIQGGILKLRPGAGEYAAITSYRLITAASITGQFTGVDSSLAFLTPLLSYSQSDVDLQLYRNDKTFASVATTPNSKAAALSIEGLANTKNPLFNAVLSLDTASAEQAFSQLTGDIHPSVKGELFQSSRFFSDSIIDHATNADVTLSKTGEADLWSSGFGIEGRASDATNAIGYDTKASGVLLGADGEVTSSLRLGGVLGYRHIDVGGDAKVDSYSLGLYSSGEINVLDVVGGAVFSFNDISTTRNIAFSGFEDRLTAAYASRATQAFLDVSARVNSGVAEFRPFATLSYVNLNTDGFQERGGPAALTSFDSVDNFATSTLGLRWSTSFEGTRIPLALCGMIGWQHAFGEQAAATRFAYSGSSPFWIEGATLPRDALVVEAGATAKLTEQIQLKFSYIGEFGDGRRSSGARADFTAKF